MSPTALLFVQCSFTLSSRWPNHALDDNANKLIFLGCDSQQKFFHYLNIVSFYNVYINIIIKAIIKAISVGNGAGFDDSKYSFYSNTHCKNVQNLFRKTHMHQKMSVFLNS